MEYLGLNKAINNIDPLVSVCITTYQHSRFIEKCVKSVLDQETEFPFEIIIGEDESSDGTREICKQLAEEHPDKIRLFLRSREDVRYINGNPTGRYNFIENLKTARGKYITISDGDDYWIDTEKLKKQTHFMKSNPEISMSLHNAYMVDIDDQRISTFPNVKGEKMIPKNRIIEKGGGYCATNSVMFKSEILIDMPDWFIDAHVGDYSLYLLAIQKGNIGALSDIMSCYRTGHNNSWSEVRNKADSIDKYLESLKTTLLNFNSYSNLEFEENIKTRIALEEIYSAVKILMSGKLYYLKRLSVNDRQYLFPAFIKILKRKIGLNPF